MIWLILAISARLLWACCNVTDQYLSRYFGREGTMSLLILQNAFGLVSACVLAAVFGIPESVDSEALLWIGLGVAANAVGVFPYLRALEMDEARHVVPLHEMTPVFVIIMAALFLGESMSASHLAGAAVIIACGFGFLWDFNYRKFKLAVLILMALSAFCFALVQIIFRLAGHSMASEDVTILFLVGVGLSGMLMALFMKRDTMKLVEIVSGDSWHILRLEVLNQVFWASSVLAITAAMAAAPTSGHVAAFSGTQPVFVTALSGVLGLFATHHFPRIAWDRDTKIKLGLLAVMCGGAVMLSL